MSFAPDTLIANRYKLVDRLGAGAMGEVWKAQDTKFSRSVLVAVKLLKEDETLADDARQRSNFEIAMRREAAETPLTIDLVVSAIDEAFNVGINQPTLRENAKQYFADRDISPESAVSFFDVLCADTTFNVNARHRRRLREMFEDEANAVAVLQHPNIVAVTDYGDEKGVPFLVMQFIKGRTLKQVIQRKEAMPVPQRLRLMEQLCEGLAYAHSKNLLHRDIKPANLIIDAETNRLKILDFGIARTLEVSAERTLSRGVPIGTYPYMSPEQTRATRTLDNRSDIFSVGSVLYEVLSYQMAFPLLTDYGDIARRIQRESPKPLSELIPDIDPGLERIVNRAIEKAPPKRYQDLVEMQRDLEAVRERLEDEIKRQAEGAGHGTTIVRQRPVLQRVTDLLDSAQNAFETEDYHAVIEFCDRVLELSPGQIDAVDLRRRAVEQVEFAKAQAVIDEGRRLLGEGDLAGAEKVLETRGMNRQLTIVREFEGELQDARRQQRVRQLLSQARAAFDKGDFAAAIENAESALSLDRNNTDARGIRRDAEQGLAREKQQHVGAIVAAADTAAREQRWDDALRLLRGIGEEPVAQERIASVEQQRDAAAARRRALAEALAEARRLRDDEDFAGAQRALASARTIDPDNPEVSDLADHLDLLIGAIDQLETASASFNDDEVDNGDEYLQRARTTIQSIADVPPSLRGLLSRAEQARASHVERQVDAAIAEANAHAAAKRFDEALAALSSISQHPRARARRDEIVRAQQARLSQQERLAAALQSARKAAAAGDFSAAAQAAADALRVDPEDEDALALQRSLPRIVDALARLDVATRAFAQDDIVEIQDAAKASDGIAAALQPFIDDYPVLKDRLADATASRDAAIARRDELEASLIELVTAYEASPSVELGNRAQETLNRLFGKRNESVGGREYEGQMRMMAARDALAVRDSARKLAGRGELDDALATVQRGKGRAKASHPILTREFDDISTKIRERDEQLAREAEERAREEAERQRIAAQRTREEKLARERRVAEALQSARDAARKGDFTAAIRAAAEALEADRNNKDARQLQQVLGQIVDLLSELDEAASVFAQDDISDLQDGLNQYEAAAALLKPFVEEYPALNDRVAAATAARDAALSRRDQLERTLIELVTQYEASPSVALRDRAAETLARLLGKHKKGAGRGGRTDEGMRRLGAANDAIGVRDRARQLIERGDLDQALAAAKRGAGSATADHPILAREIQAIETRIRERDEQRAREAEQRAREEAEQRAREEAERQRIAAERARAEQLAREREIAELTKKVQARFDRLESDGDANVPDRLDAIARDLKRLRELGAQTEVVGGFEQAIKSEREKFAERERQRQEAERQRLEEQRRAAEEQRQREEAERQRIAAERARAEQEARERAIAELTATIEQRFAKLAAPDAAPVSADFDAVARDIKALRDRGADPDRVRGFEQTLRDQRHEATEREEARKLVRKGRLEDAVARLEKLRSSSPAVAGEIAAVREAIQRRDEQLAREAEERAREEAERQRIAAERARAEQEARAREIAELTQTVERRFAELAADDANAVLADFEPVARDINALRERGADPVRVRQFEQTLQDRRHQTGEREAAQALVRKGRLDDALARLEKLRSSSAAVAAEIAAIRDAIERREEEARKAREEQERREAEERARIAAERARQEELERQRREEEERRAAAIEQERQQFVARARQAAQKGKYAAAFAAIAEAEQLAPAHADTGNARTQLIVQLRDAVRREPANAELKSLLQRYDPTVRRRQLLIAGLAAAVLLAAGAGVTYRFLNQEIVTDGEASRPGLAAANRTDVRLPLEREQIDVPKVSPQMSSLTVDLQPWARVSIKSATPNDAIPTEPILTPFTIELPAGRYQLTAENNGLTDPFAMEVTLEEGKPTIVSQIMQGFNVDSVVNALLGTNR